jgi:hypothetical protein
MTLEQRLLEYHAIALMAHVHGLAQAGLLDSEQATAALTALAAASAGPESDDPHAFLASALVASLGAEEAARLDRGHAHHDLHVTAFRLWARDAIVETGELLVELRQALTALADRSETALAPGIEPPVLFGHYLIAYVEQLYRDGNRLKEGYVRADILPLGAGDGAGVDIALDRGFVARLLGMHANTRNSVDGAGDRDFAVETLATLAGVTARLARLLHDPVLGAPAVQSLQHASRARQLAQATAESWQAALVALSGIVQGVHPVLGTIELALARAVERAEELLRLAIQTVTAAEPPVVPVELPPGLDTLVSRGGTAPSVALAAIRDTHGRIDTYRQWLVERRTAHPTVAALLTYPSEGAVPLLPHNDPPHPAGR